MIRALAALLALVALFGCRIERHLVSDPGSDQVIRVESGDRFYFDLEERFREGYRWDFKCDDPDVDVTIDHDVDDGEADVRIRIHRGFDGPTVVRFFCRAAGSRKPVRSFALTLYKYAGDRPFWE